MNGLLKWTLMLVVVCVCNTASSQPSAPVKLTKDQTARLDQAAELVEAGQLEEALTIFDGLLAEAPVDLLWLNRGRLLQRLGECQKALDAFDKVQGAASLNGVDKATIMKPMARYRSELEESCPGHLTVECQQPDMALVARRTDATSVESTCGQKIDLQPGIWSVTGTLHGQRTAPVSVEIIGTRDASVNVGLDPRALVSAGRYLMGQQDPEGAMELLEEALRLKEDQEVYLTIAEALMAQDQCQMAFFSIDAIRNAPPASAMSPLQVAQQVEALRSAFVDSCGQPVRVNCAPAEMTLRIDSGAPQVCSPAPIFLTPGTHTFAASLPQEGDEPPLTLVREVEIKAGEVSRVDMVLESEEVLGWAGWSGVVGMSLGAAALTSALIIDRTALAPKDDAFQRDKRAGVPVNELQGQLNDIESLQTTNRTLMGVGGALVVVGGALLLTDLLWLDSESPQNEEGIALGVDPDGFMVMWRTPWE